ncbi:MAG: DUF3090 family protein [Nitriliruptorales bacterium]|nr:DUF3090 family protein [Nitriliruptorales bacterium]
MRAVGESYELEGVDWVTAGAVGEPGSRTFYIQARRGQDLLAVIVEKSQVQWITRHAQELLNGVGVVVTPDDLDVDGQQLLEPIVPSWRAATLGLGMDDGGEQFVIEAEEFDPDAADESELGHIRIYCTRQQIVGMVAFAAFVVEAGARESCRFCGRPIDAVDGHVCPAANGHGPLTV